MMKSLVRQFFGERLVRCHSELLDELQMNLDLSPAEATMVIATLIADGVVAVCAAPVGGGREPPVAEWLHPGPHFATLSHSQS